MVKVEEWTDDEIADACSFTRLIDSLYNEITPTMGVETSVKSATEFSAWKTGFREKIVDLLGIRDILANRPEICVVKGDPDQCVDKGTYRIEHFYLKSWHDTLIPVLLTVPNHIPKGALLPAFVCTHGHGQNKDILNGLASMPQYPQSHWAQDLAEMGCITISMDQWGWFERGWGGKYNGQENSYAHKMLLIGRTINGLRFTDAMRQVDYLLTRSDVDPKKIGIGGLSLGGTTASWTAAIDERIRLAVVAGYMGSFKESIVDYNHCSCNYIPNMQLYGEMYDVMALIAPRPVCFICGKQDTTFYHVQAIAAYERLKKTYTLLGVENNCVLDEPDQGHDWNGTIAYPFIKKHFCN